MTHHTFKIYLNPLIHFCFLMCFYWSQIKIRLFDIRGLYIYFVMSVCISAFTYIFSSKELKKQKLYFFKSVLSYISVTGIYVLVKILLGSGSDMLDEEGFGQGITLIVFYVISLFSLIIGNFVGVILRRLRQGSHLGTYIFWHSHLGTYIFWHHFIDN